MCVKCPCKLFHCFSSEDDNKTLCGHFYGGYVEGISKEYQLHVPICNNHLSYFWFLRTQKKVWPERSEYKTHVPQSD